MTRIRKERDSTFWEHLTTFCFKYGLTYLDALMMKYKEWTIKNTLVKGL